jgi:phosphate transport system protein
LATDHIVKSYDDELNLLNANIVQMGGLVEAQLAAAMEVVATRDTRAAAGIVESDDKVDELNYQIDSQTIRLLALRQPMAMDLRNVIGAIKISSDLERIADYAANVAKRSIVLNESPPVASVRTIPRMGQVVQAMIRDVLDAYVSRDAGKAVEVWRRDEEVDEMYIGLFREILTYMMEDPRNITPFTHLMFMAKHMERIGDHITNIAETVYFLVRGKRLRESRERGGDAGKGGEERT